MIPKDVQDRIIYHLEAFKISNKNASEYDMSDVSFKNVMKRHNNEPYSDTIIAVNAAKSARF